MSKQRISFEAWKWAVNRCVETFSGMSADDLPDWDYYRAWENGVDCMTAAKNAIKAAREF